MVKASEAELATLLFDEQGSDPSTPASGFGRLYAKDDGVYFIDDAGSVTGPLVDSAGSAFAFKGVRVTQQSAQTIAHDTVTALTFGAGSEDYDTDGFHDTGSNTDRHTVPAGEGGKYLCGVQVVFAANTTGLRQVRMRKNGSTNVAWVRNVATEDAGRFLNGVGVIELAATDYVACTVYQDSGGDLDTFDTAGQQSYFWMHRLDP